jgi:hypothetical protein
MKALLCKEYGPPEQFTDAFAAITQRRAKGKVVLTFD